MIRDLDYFQNESINRGICDFGVAEWANTGGDKQKLFDFALHSISVPYMAMAIQEGWGMTTEYLLKEFASYINGNGCANVLAGEKTIKGEMYVSAVGTPTINANISTIIACPKLEVTTTMFATQFHVNNGSNVTFKLPERCMISVYLYDNSTIDLGDVGEGQKLIVYIYGDEPIADRVHYTDCGGSISFRKRDLKVDAIGVYHANNK